MSPQLADVRSQLEAASGRARKLVAGVSIERLGRRPNPTSWSIAECLAHLTITNDAYLPAIREALAEARRRNLHSNAHHFQTEMMARLLAWWLEPPYRLKSKTPPAFVPEAADAGRSLPDFLDRQEKLLTLLGEADGFALDELKIESPFAKQVRYNVYSAFRLIAVHERRHLWQAERVADVIR